jgi:hypothetical protein
VEHGKPFPELRKEQLRYEIIRRRPRVWRFRKARSGQHRLQWREGEHSLRRLNCKYDPVRSADGELENSDI